MSIKKSNENIMKSQRKKMGLEIRELPKKLRKYID